MNKLLFVMVLSVIFFSGCVGLEMQRYIGNNTNVQFCYEQVNKGDGLVQKEYNNHIQKCNDIGILESYHFSIKETRQKDLTDGSISGSFLLVGGNVYGRIEDKMYLVVTYYDPRINTYKITKLNLEAIEINTINKNDSAYFKLRVVPESHYFFPFYKFDKTRAILYLPDGWSII